MSATKSASVVLSLCLSVVLGLATASGISDLELSKLSGGISDGVPRLDLPSLESGYHGLVQENETTVEVKPSIRAIGAEICSFRIVNKHHGDAPFDIILKEDGEGEVQLKPHRTLNCEKRKNYRFDIAAVSCSGEVSENATLHITVIDINEYAPVFLQPSYVYQVDEGRLYSEIVRVEAKDRDCTPKFGDICKYEILTTEQPFTIDNEGVIRNTEPLDFEKSHNHILSVVAYDCGMKQSVPVMVTIKVNRVCRLGWNGIPERIDYAPSSGRVDLFPSAELQLCDVPCQVRQVDARVALTTAHIGKGCDRDTYSVASQRKLCGASQDSIDLLPSPASGAEWTKNLQTDEGHEGDQMYEFDGVTSALAVPPSVLDHTLASTFTMSTWMKHKPQPGADKHMKEHIICSADDHKMNRHHYALFVRNCRLILLLRRDFSDDDPNTFRPAEWRWKLPQVCDDIWHHYAVEVKFPDVQLYVDGQLFKTERKNPEIIDDWPLHPTKGINTTVTVGACWQGSENKMKHHFHGYLAGLSVLLHRTERPEVLTCLHKCKESLEVPAMELLEPGMELLTNSDLTELSIKGDNKTNLEVLMRRVGYTNSREFPTPGRRNLHISTTITCDHGKVKKVPSLESYVMVLQPQEPTISINGTSNLARDYEDFRQGVRVFTDVHVTVGAVSGNKHSHDTSGVEKKLDSCSVSVYPSLNPDHETLSLPENMLTQFGVVAKVNKDGVIVSGADLIYNYEQILRQIQYTNRKPAYYLNRVFKLICSELNGRFLSNEYVQTLTVIHPRMTGSKSTEMPHAANKHDHDHLDVHEKKASHDHAPQPAHAHVDRHHVELHPAQVSDEHSLMDGVQAVTGASHAVTIIIVVCVGFLLFMIVLGVIRIRAAHHRANQEEIADTEMAWDDSALTITVNPMEQLNGSSPSNGQGPASAGGRGRGEHCDDDDSSDDGSSYRDDDLDSTDEEEEEVESGKHKDLEWDNSTLAI
ncbi:calsyntenin-1 isoform X1 [Thrips palmi]|uniref:Calsyntenin-1 isoform X1 n=1 Tax=Thrips palmi TaxID=161013 RepID=A0A6P8Y7R0_THRPL|nr:calsyntenin-1 isoform X1 [Thrips palmi]